MGNPEIIYKQIPLEKLKKQINYSESQIQRLFINLPKDFYGRMSFEKIQKIILNDRNVRLNYIIAQTLKVPISKIHQKNKVDADQHQIPLSILDSQSKVLKVHKKPSDWVFKKKKLNSAEQFYKQEMLTQRYQHLFERKHFYKENKQGTDFTNSLNIMRF